MISTRCSVPCITQNFICSLCRRNFSTSISQETHYDVLEIAKDSSLEDVKNAFIKKSMLYHPDRHQGDQSMNDKFVRISEAYRVLSDPEQRALYNYELTKGAGNKFVNTVHRSKDYRSPYRNVKGFTTDWSDYYSTYGGGKAERDMKRDAETRFWKEYWENTKKYGGGETQDGMSPMPKSNMGFEMLIVSGVLIAIYILGFIHSSTGDKSMDHDSFDNEHMNWLLEQKNKKRN